MNGIPNNRSAELQAIVDRFGIEVALLFGSRARGTIHRESDTDIAVRAERELTFDEKLDLARAFDRLFPEVEIVDIRTAPPLLLGAIAKDGKPIFERVPGLGNAQRVWAMNQYLDYEPYLRRMGRRES